MIRVAIEPSRLTVGREERLTVLFANTGTGICTDIVFKLELPPGFLLLGGRNRVEIAKILPGRDHGHELIVEPSRPGDFAVLSTNFSYRDEFGVPVRVRDFRAQLSVLDPEPMPEVPVTLGIECVGHELALGEWDVLTISVRNVTGVPVSDVTLTVGGLIRTDGSRATIAALVDGATDEVSFPVFAAEGGRHVPVTARTTYSFQNQLGSARRQVQEDRFQIVVRRPQAQATPTAPASGRPREQTILYLTAGPKDLDLLRSNEEMRNVKERLQLGKYRDRFRLEACLAARLADINQALGDYEPQIVHFSGHGNREGSLDLEDETGYSDPATPDGLAALFALYAHTIRCVIVNACHSMRLAEAMAGQIEYVVAMRGEIGDGAAILFSVGFYQGLFAGRPVPDAFSLGRTLLQAKQMAMPEYKTPVLLTRLGS